MECKVGNQEIPGVTGKSDPEVPFLGFYLEKIRSERIHAPQCSLKISGVTRKFGLGVKNEAGQRLIEFCQENTLVIANTL